MTNQEGKWLTQLPKNWPWEATERDYELYEKGGLKIHLGKTGIPIKKDQLKYLCEIGNKGEGPILPRKYVEDLVSVGNSSLSTRISQFTDYYPDSYRRVDECSSAWEIDVNEFVRYAVHYNRYMRDAKKAKDRLQDMTKEDALRFTMWNDRHYQFINSLATSHAQDMNEITILNKLAKGYKMDNFLVRGELDSIEKHRQLLANEMKKNGSYDLIKKYYERLVMMLKQQYKW